MRTLEAEAPPVERHVEASGRPLLDVAGAVLAAATVLWIGVVARRGSGFPSAALLVPAAAAAYAAARLAGLVARWPVPLGVAGVALWLFLRQPGPTLNEYPLGGPLLYSNARGGFFALAAGAGLMAAAAVWRRRWIGPPVAVVALGAAVVLAIVPFHTGTHAGMIAVAGFAAAAPAGWSPRAVRGVIAAAAAALVLTLAVTMWLAATYGGPEGEGVADRLVEGTALHEHRVEGWHEALEVMAAHPLRGVGPGRFHEESVLATDTFYERNVRHGFLQVGAETGVPGTALVLALFLWVLARLWASPAPDRLTALGAVAVAALGMHACVDFVLHFPAVTLVAAALAGTATAPGR